MGLRETNAALNESEYAARKVELTSRPTMLFVELTRNCNAHCLMCRSAASYDPAMDMDSRLFDDIADTLMPYASVVDLRGWGESTILRLFDRHLDRAAGTGARLRIVTNGLAMTPYRWERFWRTDGIVAVSVDSASPERFAELGRGDLTKVLANIRDGVAARERIGSGTLYLITVVSAFNVGELTAIVNMAATFGVTKIVLKPLGTWEGHYASAGEDTAALGEALRQAATLAASKNVTLQLPVSLAKEFVCSDALPSSCTTPWSHAVISYNGQVRFCDHLLTAEDSALGDLGSTSFDKVWNGPGYVKLRQAHVEAERTRDVGRCFGRCTWCYGNRYMAPDPAPIGSEAFREVSTRGPHRVTGP